LVGIPEEKGLLLIARPRRKDIIKMVFKTRVESVGGVHVAHDGTDVGLL
jgi:hypothetical protein